MFTIFADGHSVYQPLIDELVLLAPKLTLEMGKAGALSFQVPPGHRYYGGFTPFSTRITVEMDGVEIFRGRVLTNSRTFNNVRSVYCEGDLAYLVDSVQKAEKFEGKAHDLFRQIIAAHNARVEPEKRFTVGEITVENRDVLLAGQSDDIEDVETGRFNYKQIAINSMADEWQNTFDFIQSCLIDYTGGYLRTRHLGDATYIDLVADYGQNAAQEIAFGKNLLDLTEEINVDELFTVLIPLGDENLTIESVNNGSDELADTEAVARYGRIVKTHVFESVSDPNTLLENAQRFLVDKTNPPVTLTVKAVDMHLVDSNASPIYVGDRVFIASAPHGFQDMLTCSKIEYDLENPGNNTYTFGTPRQSLTERYRKDKAKKDGGGGGAGGAAEVLAEEEEKQRQEIFDAWINVDPEAGHIDLGTLYQKFNDAVQVLKSTCGISLDAPSGNINIKTLRTDFDELGNKVRDQAAYIDVLNNENKARIALVAARGEDIANLESSHYAQLTVSIDDLGSAIKMKADQVDVEAINLSLRAVTTWQEGAENQITAVSQTLEATSRKLDDLSGEVGSMSSRLTALADDTSTSLTMLSESVSSQGTKIAAVETKASNLESSINLKADKTTVNSKITSINSDIIKLNGRVESLEADYANIKTLITNELNAYFTSTRVLTVGEVICYGKMSIKGSNVATQQWVKEQLLVPPLKVHTHKFSFSLPNGHTHTVSVDGTSYTTGGVSLNSMHQYSGTTEVNS